MKVFITRIYFSIVIVCMVVSPVQLERIGCKNEDGVDVEWFIVYKMPHIHEYRNNGTEYIIMDASSSKWENANYTIDNSMSAIGKTLEHLYSVSIKDTIYAIYNDEWPDGRKTFTKGHTKGVFVADTASGFWLVHSIPKFPPPANSSYNFPHSAHMFGQSLLCISVSSSQYDRIGLQMLYNTPYIYDHNMPIELRTIFLNLTSAMSGKQIMSPPWFHIQPFSGILGTAFLSFAKTRDFGKDIYDGLVAPHLQVNLLTETWQNGEGPLQPSCKLRFHVNNIKMLSFEVNSYTFTSHMDHSKWAISDAVISPWVCVGDINRMAGQFARGGGTVCINVSKIWNNFYSIVEEHDQCPDSLETNQV